MTGYRVVFAPAAEEQLGQLYRYIASQASPDIADRFVSALVDHCEGMVTLPLRGTRRDDIRANLRITHFRKRTVIAFVVEQRVISIIGVYYGGQDYKAVLQS